MIKQEVVIKSPIKVIPSKNYLLVIEDADGIAHYWHNKHKHEGIEFKEGQYDGWSRELIENKLVVKDTFREKLKDFINTQSLENQSDTPDWVLANFLANSLKAFDIATNLRTEFYGSKNATITVED